MSDFEEINEDEVIKEAEEWLKEQKSFEEELKNVKGEREEPESVKAWNREQIVRIEEKDKMEEIDKEKLREKAKKELEEMHKRYEESVKAGKAKRKLEEAEETEKSGGGEENQWERISNLLDLTAKPKIDGRKDVSRMRSVIIQLKNDPKSTKSLNL